MCACVCARMGVRAVFTRVGRMVVSAVCITTQHVLDYS